MRTPSVLLMLIHVLVLVFLPSIENARTTNGEMPVITSISPRMGGAEGGTHLTIAGLNFMQMGLNSYTVVTIAGTSPCLLMMTCLNDKKIKHNTLYIFKQQEMSAKLLSTTPPQIGLNVSLLHVLLPTAVKTW